MITHNSVYNVAQKPWSPSADGSQVKRRAEEPAVGQDAIVPTIGPDDFTSMDQIKKAHSALCEKTLGACKLVVGHFCIATLGNSRRANPGNRSMGDNVIAHKIQ